MPLITSLKKRFIDEVCPYCFEYFRFLNAPFRCGNLSCSGRTPDPILKSHWPVLASGSQGKVLDANQKKSGQVKCDACQHVAKDRLCPNCHVTLPTTFGQCDNAIVAVVGAKNSGKSNFIATFVEEFRNRVGPALNITLAPQDDFTIRRFATEFRDPLYREHRVVNVTNSGMRDVNVRLPMVFTLQFGGRNFLNQKTILRTITLVFFDTAGEDLKNQSTMETVNRYIYRSHGIILLLDPRQMNALRSKLVADKNEATDEARDIINRIRTLIVTGRQLDQNQPIPTPIAVAFSKFDELERFIDSDMAVVKTRSTSNQYDMADTEAVSTEIESLLDSWQQQGMVHELKMWFSKVSFFGISSLGCKKREDNTIPHLDPRRVEDPFLWLLYQFGYIKSKSK